MKICIKVSPLASGVEAVVIPVIKSRGLQSLFHHYPEFKSLARRLKFTGKSGEAITFYATKTNVLMIAVGTGRSVSGSVIDTVKCAKKIISVLNSNKISRASIAFYHDAVIPQGFWLNFIDFLYISNYRFDTYLKKDEDFPLKELKIWFDNKTSGSRLTPQFFREREIIRESVEQARNLINEPAAVVNPDMMVQQSLKLAETYEQLKVTVYKGKELIQQGLNGTYTVGMASPYSPAMIGIDYLPQEEIINRVALVGKGVTFDSGGMNIKPGNSMYDMKADMSGAAAVFSVMTALARLELPIAVHAYLPVAENMVDRHSFKPGDIITYRNKTTVEVINTDAEGRLMLADALILAAERKPGYIVELSTLTGTMVKALGESVAGVMGNHNKLISQLMRAGKNTGERIWHLPMIDDYRESIKSKIADLKNAGYGGGAGAIKAGLFLEHFIDRIPFAHIDIAGTAYLSKSTAFYANEGATGFGVRLLLEFLQMLVNPAYEKK